MLQSVQVEGAQVLVQGLGQELMALQDGVAFVEMIAGPDEGSPVGLHSQAISRRLGR